MKWKKKQTLMKINKHVKKKKEWEKGKLYVDLLKSWRYYAVNITEKTLKKFNAKYQIDWNIL